MKTLITGGCGFLGTNLAAEALRNNESVVVIDSLSRNGSESNLDWLRTKANPSELVFECLDVADEKKLVEVFKRHAPFDRICHVAGQVAMTSSLQDPRNDFRSNVVGTFNLLEVVREFSPSALLTYSSTNKVYGDLEYLNYGKTKTRYTLSDYPDGLDEKIPLDFSTPYGCSKGAADQYVHDWGRVYGLQTVVFRHSSIYGGRQFATIDQGWVGWFCKKALEEQACRCAGRIPKTFTVSGTGKQVRDILYVDDAVQAYRAAYENRDTAAGHVFNIGGGQSNSVSILELLSYLAQLLQLDGLTFTTQERRVSDQKVFIANLDSASTLLNWSPKVDLKAGLSKQLDWLKQLENRESFHLHSSIY